jgi:prepilin-type N-terminal cleavage/methylation domain-containing protein
MTTYRASHGFTLIELIIVIGLLGALAAIVLPTLSVKRVESLEQIVAHDMAEIREAFQRLHRDAVLDTTDLDWVRRYGLYALMEQPDSSLGTWSLPNYDPQRERGWRGPYVEQEGRREIDTGASAFGQPSGTDEVPVIEDPFSASDADGHYYRVVAPKDTNGDNVYGETLLVCVGPNGTLDITLPTLAVGAMLDLDNLTDGNDDIVIRLCPWVE